MKLAARCRAYMLVLVAAMLLVCLGQETLSPEEVPSCDASKLIFVDPIDLEKLKGKWYRMYSTYLPLNYPGVMTSIDYYRIAAGLVTISMKITTAMGKDVGCRHHQYLSYSLVKGGRWEYDNVDYSGILAIDYNSTFGSFIMWSLETTSSGQYPVVNIYVRDPFNFPTLDDVIARSQVKDFCDPGADDPSSDFYPVVYPFKEIPTCFYQQ